MIYRLEKLSENNINPMRFYVGSVCGRSCGKISLTIQKTYDRLNKIVER